MRTAYIRQDKTRSYVGIIHINNFLTDINFWPWYNHTVFVFQLIGLYFLVHHLLKSKSIVFLGLSAFFTALCFFTKQDAGGLAFMLAMALLIANGLLDKQFKSILLFVGFYILSIGLFILPLLRYDFSYWFNHGQPPHFSRINLFDFLSSFFEESLFIKFYIGGIIIVAMVRFKTWQSIVEDKVFLLFTLLTLGIMVQAMIIQVTSFSPPTVNYYFHSFAIAYFLYVLKDQIRFEKIWIALLLLTFIFIWRSENTWKYSNRIFSKVIPGLFAPPDKTEISKNTWAAKDSVQNEPVEWSTSSYKSMKRIKLPTNTISGIKNILDLEVVKNKKDLKVLNLSNLSPLAFEIGYVPDSGPEFPLWYHKGVAFFDREEKMLCEKIKNHYYDLIIFENMPHVESFFSFAVEECTFENYSLTDKFLSPTGYPHDSIEVFINKPLE